MYFKKILSYGADTWTCTKREESKLQAVEMKFLRAIVGKTRRERIRNTNLGRGQDGGDTEQNQEKKSRLRWFGHVRRTDEHRIPKRLSETKMNGRRPRGRPCT
jgi:hypothetical protein